ncbi:MAG: phosphopyruvate hydratase [Armatimonadetes bacterium]|nr:MAG: phosphopyruvate hydratase [Armatimonadota bacterium]
MKIDGISLKIIPDSRGDDTLEATLKSGDFTASASVPSGKSTGKNEVAVVSAKQALDKISWLTAQLKDHDFVTLDQFDQLLITLDGTENKSNLGGNLILALSMAFCRLLSKAGNLELYQLLAKISGTKSFSMPFCFYNLIEGGVHTPPGDLPFQEYLFVPQTQSPRESLNHTLIFIKALEEKIKERFGQVNFGDEGGYVVPSNDPMVGLQILQEVTEETGFSDSKLSLDVAASSFVEDGKYRVGDKLLDKEQLLEAYKQIVNNYPVLSIEDPFSEEDWQGFTEIAKKLGDRVWIVGDDLTTTNVKRIKQAESKKAANAVIIKPNQIGSVSEAIQAARLAKSYGWKIIVSHRSGETLDTFIADLAVGLGADGLKSGCPLQKERLVKYERLVEIESRIKTK